MLEIKVTINTPDLSEALTNLALAIKGDVIQKSDEMVIPAGTPMQVTQVAPAPVPAQQTAVPTQQATVPVQQPVNPVPVQQAAPQPITQAPIMPPPAAAPKIDLDAISRAGAALADAGKMTQILDLLKQFGVPAITMLREDQYPAFADGMKALGAKFD